MDAETAKQEIASKLTHLITSQYDDQARESVTQLYNTFNQMSGEAKAEARIKAENIIMEHLKSIIYTIRYIREEEYYRDIPDEESIIRDLFYILEITFENEMCCAGYLSDLMFDQVREYGYDIEEVDVFSPTLRHSNRYKYFNELDYGKCE